MSEDSSFVPVKEWARKYISPDNELQDAILTERDTMSRIEVGMKIAAYNNMLEAKARRIKKGIS
jgi:hypothetical protein